MLVAPRGMECRTNGAAQMIAALFLNSIPVMDASNVAGNPIKEPLSQLINTLASDILKFSVQANADTFQFG